MNLLARVFFIISEHLRLWQMTHALAPCRSTSRYSVSLSNSSPLFISGKFKARLLHVLFG